MQHDGVTVVALMTLAAFAVERITKGILFVLSFLGGWRKFIKADEEKRQSLAYFVVAGLLVLAVVLISPEMRVLTILNIETIPLLDIGLTWLVLVAGSDQVGKFVKGESPASSAPPKPVEVKGTLRLVNDESDAA